MTKEIIIIALILALLYLTYRQNNLATSSPDNSAHQTELKKLQSEVQHYQTLYQKRVAKDLEGDQTEKIKELTVNLAQATEQSQLFEQKIKAQDTALMDLAKRKIKGKKEAEKILND